MNEQKIIEAMARVDGVYRDELPDIQLLRGEWVQKCDYGRKLHPIPAYTTSHDACQRVIDGLDRDTKWKVVNELAKILFRVFMGKANSEVAMYFLCATPLQKCEAILKALGKWTKEMEG